MKFVLVLFCTLSVVYSRPETQVKINVNNSSGFRAGTGVLVQHSGGVESRNVHVAHNHERTEVNVNGVGRSGSYHDTSVNVDGSSGSQSRIVIHGLRLPSGRLSGNINLF